MDAALGRGQAVLQGLLGAAGAFGPRQEGSEQRE
jgi:hypothetical protein